MKSDESMSIHKSKVRNVSIAAAGDLVFPYDFKVLTQSDLQVQVNGVDKHLGVDFTVSGIAEDEGGNITFKAPMDGGEVVMRRRNMDFSRLKDAGRLGNSAADAPNGLGGMIIMFMEQLADDVERSLKLPLSDGRSVEIPFAMTARFVSSNGQASAPMETGLDDDDTTLRQDLAAPTGAGLVGFQQLGVGTNARDALTKLRESYSTHDVIPADLHSGIAAGTGTVNLAGYITQALANSDDVVMPPGTYYVTDTITVPAGKRLRGSGRHKTIVRVPSSFTSSAQGVIGLQNGSEPGGSVEDISIVFFQPDTNARAGLIQYPPAISAVSSPRFALRRLRIENAWNGIDMKGNSGGSNIEDVEISAFNIDLDIDGSLDSVKISKWHAWPFGLTARPMLYNLYENASHISVKSGRCDDFHLSDSIFYSLQTATSFYRSDLGSTFGNIVNVDFDDRGGLNVSAGALSLAACYFTIGKSDAVVANISGGSVSMAGCNGSITVIPNGGNAILVGGADTQFSMAGGLWGLDANDAGLVVGNGGCRMTISGVGTNRNANVAYTRATFNYANARGAISGCVAGMKGAGAGVFVSVGTDTSVLVSGNNADGWSYSFPPGALANSKLGRSYVLGEGAWAGTPDASGNLVITLNTPHRPRRVIVTATGTGALVHTQVFAVSDTSVSVNVRSGSGGIVTTPVSGDWVAFA